VLGAGACEVVVAEFDDGAGALCALEAGACVWAELFDEGFAVCAELRGAVVEVDSCCRCAAGGFELEVFGLDCANAEVANATAALLTNNKRLFI
jgi:hypothetical protein